MILPPFFGKLFFNTWLPAWKKSAERRKGKMKQVNHSVKYFVTPACLFSLPEPHTVQGLLWCLQDTALSFILKPSLLISGFSYLVLEANSYTLKWTQIHRFLPWWSALAFPPESKGRLCSFLIKKNGETEKNLHMHSSARLELKYHSSKCQFNQSGVAVVWAHCWSS